MRQFWGQQQRFFKEMANAAKVEFVVAQAKEALSSGMSVVIGLQSTGESGMDKVGSVVACCLLSVRFYCCGCLDATLKSDIGVYALSPLSQESPVYAS